MHTKYKTTIVEIEWMNGKTRECRTNLSKEFLDVAVSRKGNLGMHEILYEVKHVDILNQRERIRLLRRSCRGIRRDGLPLPWHRGNVDITMGRSWNKVPRKDRRSCRWNSDNCGSWSALNGCLGKKQVDTWLEDTLFPLPLAFTDATSLSLVGGAGFSFFFGSSSNSKTSRVDEARLL